MRLGIISDIHGRLGSAREAAKILATKQVDEVICCGDIGSPDVIEVLANWHVHFVWGNVDGMDVGPMTEAMRRFGHVNHDRFGELELEGIKIGFLHGDNLARLQETIQSGKFQLVCHGHTHEIRQEYVGGTLVLNPGALHRASPRSLAIVDLPSLTVEICRLSEQVSATREGL